MPTSKNPPSRPFSRAELVAYALGGGIRERLRALEQEIARLQKQFPEVMMTTPVVLLKPEVRAGGSTWPLQAPDETKSAAMRARWTPKRRKEQAERMRKNAPHLRQMRTKKAAKKAAPADSKKSSSSWQRMRSALLLAPDYQGTSKEIQAAAGISNVLVANAFRDHPDLFKKVEKGVYALTTAGKNGDGASA